jgi:translocation and assembly module TamA
MVRVRVVVLIGIFLTANLAVPARADWFFGLFGGSEAAPEPRADAASYKVEIQIIDRPEDKGLASILQDASNLYRLRQQPPENGEGLARRASADLPRLVDALWAESYYDASARAFVDGQPIDMGGTGLEAAANAAERAIGRSVVQVRLAVEAGALYRIGEIRVVDAQTGEPFDPDLVQPRVLKLQPGDPARANAIRDMQSRIVDALRAKSYPLAKVTEAKAIIHHPQQQVDLLVKVDSGRRGGIGEITITGTRNLDPAVVRSFIYVEPGDPYSPAKIAAMRKSMGQIEAIGSIRILESDHFDADGNLPLTVVVDERKQYAVSAAVQYSTIDGPSLRADWVDRNIFGGGERLRLSATMGYSTENGDLNNHGGWFNPDQLIGRANANFIKPALDGSRNDYIADFTLAREVAESYNAEYFNTTHVIRHRFDETFSIQGGVELERGASSDYFGKTNYLLVGLNGALRYDTTDNPLDPKSGWRVIVTGGAYPRFLGSSIDLYQGMALASTYYSLDEDGKYILAGRVGLGAEGGANVLDIPDNRRFFAGGGGSVRGYAYRSLAPLGYNGQPVGGESLFEASVEARVKITDSIGVVPFFDAGTAYASSFPNFQQDMRYAAGLGLRYYTGFGPIRLDVAVPLSRPPGTAPVAAYIGIGQAF